MNLVRRRLLQFLGASATVPVSLPLTIAPMLAKASAVSQLVSAPANGSPIPNSAEARLGKPLAVAIGDLLERHRDQTWSRMQMRTGVGGFDPDIACMQSWSLATKMRKQMERDDESTVLRRQIEKVMYG